MDLVLYNYLSQDVQWDSLHRSNILAFRKTPAVSSMAVSSMIEQSPRPATGSATLNRDPRVLVVTLYSGENEFDQCVAALRAQDYPNWQHKVFSNLPNKQAHRACYSEIMARREYDFFIKLDADMVFADEGALGRIVRFLQARPNLDHALFAVHDFMSDSLLLGLHVFSRRAKWAIHEDDLFVDPPPDIPGERQVIWDAPAPLVRHSPDPSPYHAFRFGVHRAFKAFQPDRLVLDVPQSKAQWCLLTKIWDHFERTRDRRLGLAVLGADLAWQGKLDPALQEYAGSEVQAEFAKYANQSASDLHRVLSARWAPGPVRRWNRIKDIGPRLMLSVAINGITGLRTKMARLLRA